MPRFAESCHEQRQHCLADETSKLQKLTMRHVQIFSGTSHPQLTEAICERLGCAPAKADLKKFSNGETNVNIGTSVRDQDVFIVQSGSPKINDSVMELLIMISACKGASAKSVTGKSHPTRQSVLG